MKEQNRTKTLNGIAYGLANANELNWATLHDHNPTLRTKAICDGYYSGGAQIVVLMPPEGNDGSMVFSALVRELSGL